MSIYVTCDDSADAALRVGNAIASSLSSNTARVLRLSVGGGVETLTAVISAGVVVWNRSMSILGIDTEEEAPADDLNTITGGHDGDILILRCVDAAREVKLKHGTGNLFLPSAVDFVLDHVRDRVVLLNVGGNTSSGGEWVALCASSNG